MSGWQRDHGGGQPTHVYPLNDLREHETEGVDCWCNPEVDDDGQLITHNSLDGREKFETGERKPS